MATLRSSVQRLTSAYRTQLKQLSDLQMKMKNFRLKTSYYNQLGLMYHDILPEAPAVTEALKRLPREELEARDFRVSRAFHLSANKTILPQEEWTTVENDVPYLDPYIQSVLKDWREKADWDEFVVYERYP